MGEIRRYHVERCPRVSCHSRLLLFVLTLFLICVCRKQNVVHGLQLLDRAQFWNSLYIASHPGLLLSLRGENNPSPSLLVATSSGGGGGGEMIGDNTSADTLVCRNGALVPEQAIPGAYNQVCMSLPERSIPLNDKRGGGTNNDTAGEIVLKIRQEPSGSGRTGMAVWNSGLVLTRLLERLAPILSPSSVLELGCGTGLVSIAASRLWKSADVLATDGNPDVVRLAQCNIELNCANEKNDDNKCEKLQATFLQWGLLNAVEYSADLILGADLTYNSGSWRVLAETMSTILTPAGCVVYVSLGHEGFNVNPEIDGFLSVAREVGGLVPVTELDGISINETLLKDILSPSEAKNVQASGGVRVAVLRRKEFLKRQAKAASK